MSIKVFAENLDEATLEQIKALGDNPVFSGSKVRIMPDAHVGNSCVIGFTCKLGDLIIPNVIGVDIGCSVTALSLGNIDIDLESLDHFIHNNIPSGFNVNKDINPASEEITNKLFCMDFLKNKDRIDKALGSLGGGNHFVELAVDAKKQKYLLVHTGSHNLGLQVANHYQNIANSNGGSLGDVEKHKYMHDMCLCQEWAKLNSLSILNKIGNFLQAKQLELIQSIHNYIDFDDKTNSVIRKGAISAKKDELCLIPINMRDGTLLCKGKGNSDWNYSAPHGAGRVLGRGQAKRQLNIDDFKSSMQGVYSSCISENTLDESPMSYKGIEYIKRMIEPTVKILDVLKPIYNFKGN